MEVLVDHMGCVRCHPKFCSNGIFPFRKAVHMQNRSRIWHLYYQRIKVYFLLATTTGPQDNAKTSMV